MLISNEAHSMAPGELFDIFAASGSAENWGYI